MDLFKMGMKEKDFIETELIKMDLMKMDVIEIKN